MPQKNSTKQWLPAVLGQLGWPLILGLAASTLFYALILQGPLRTEATLRYFASHPVSVCASTMFFIGMAALILKALNTLGQFGALGKATLGLDHGETVAASQCDELIEGVQNLPSTARESYLGRRLRNVLEYVRSRGGADGVDDELKYLSDMDAAKQQDSYALVRIIIWATPMLGFLGTVIGITQALGDLDPAELATSVQSAMDKLLSGLYVAFDTTALALTLSIVLMFLQFLVDRVETQLLGMVDQRMHEEFRGRFESVGTANDPFLHSIERMGHAVLTTAEVLVKQQAELWRESLDHAQQKWMQTADDHQAHFPVVVEWRSGRIADGIPEVDGANRARGRRTGSSSLGAMADHDF